MATFYISPTGDDSAGDGSEGNPWRNVIYALSNTGAADTIIVKEGVNVQTLSFTSSAIGISQRKIIGENPDGRLNVIDGNGLCIWNEMISDPEAEIRNITIKNSETETGRRSFFRGFDGLIEGCIFDNIVHAGSLNDVQGSEGLITASNAIIRNCIIKNIRCPAGKGATVIPVKPVVPDGKSITFDKCVFYTDAENLTGYANPTSYVFCRAVTSPDGTSESATFNNCIFYVPTAGFFSRGLYDVFDKAGVNASVTFNNCCYYNLDISLPKPRLTLNNTITDDPLFVDPENGKFDPRPGSPCLGKGSVL